MTARDSAHGIDAMGVHGSNNGIVDRILDGLEQDDRMIRHAVKEFLAAREKAMKEEFKEEEILYRIQAPEVVEAIVECGRQQIESDAAHRRMKLAAGRHEIAKKKVIQAIGEFEEDLDPESEWSLSVHHLVLLKKESKDKNEEETQEIFAGVIQFAKRMATEVDEVELQRIREHDLPEAGKRLVEKLSGLEDFFTDLADLLLESGEKGKRIVLSVCEESSVAKELAEDDKSPKPVKFLAKMAVAILKKNRD